MLGSLIYTLPQKKCYLQEPAFLLGRSVFYCEPVQSLIVLDTSVFYKRNHGITGGGQLC